MSKHVRADLYERFVCFADQCGHVVIMAGAEFGIARPQCLLLLFRVKPQSIIPDVVLRKTDVDIKSDILLGAGKQSIDGSRGANQAGLIIGVG